MKTQLKITMAGLFGLVLFAQQSVASAGEVEIRACLKKALSKEYPIYQVAEDKDDAGKFSRYLVMICEGDAAKALYNSIIDQTYPGDWSGKTQGNLKYLGETGGSSLCYHITRDSSGIRSDNYNCSIRLSVAAAVLGKTTKDGMAPFDTK